LRSFRGRQLRPRCHVEKASRVLEFPLLRELTEVVSRDNVTLQDTRSQNEQRARADARDSPARLGLVPLHVIEHRTLSPFPRRAANPQPPSEMSNCRLISAQPLPIIACIINHSSYSCSSPAELERAVCRLLSYIETSVSCMIAGKRKLSVLPSHFYIPSSSICSTTLEWTMNFPFRSTLLS
jgi:hypothetical protein